MDFKDYQLLDSGGGRRLERFGEYVVDRPTPIATWKKELSEEIWQQATHYFDREKKAWTCGSDTSWQMKWHDSVFNLVPASQGQIGIFPEQEFNWSWLHSLISNSSGSIKVLNCFAYTGGSTLACATAGAEVTHLDAAKGSVARARENANLSGLKDASIRWIVDDAVKFMERELKRGKSYDGIILDPPAFGRMGKQVWKLEKDLPRLLKIAGELLSMNPLFFLLSSHPPGWKAGDLLRVVRDNMQVLRGKNLESGELTIKGQGNDLPLGLYCRTAF